jgi:serine protease Do
MTHEIKSEIQEKDENVSDFMESLLTELEPIEKREIPNKTENKKNSKWKPLRGVVSTITAGVVGSVLTLAVLPHTDYLNQFMKNSNHITSQSEQTESATAVVKPVSTQSTAMAAGTRSIADTVEKVSKAIVGIVNYRQQPINNFYGNSNSSQDVESGSGSGVIFQKAKDNAYIVTNNHVVEGATKLEISLYNGEKTTATVVGTDALTDLAVLKINAKYVNDTVNFGDSATLRPGDPVYAIGNPLGLDLSRTVTQGIVSATNRNISISTSAGNWETNVIQTDAAINPGNSGGALINPDGQVIGINSLKISENGVEGLGFAIPSNDLIPIVNELIKNGKIERPYLGIGLADLNEIPQMYWDLPSNVEKGVMVTSVDQNSAAASAGFRQRDVIISMNGTKIESSADLRKYLYTKVNKGDKVKFDIYRNGKKMSLQVNLSK